LAIATITGARPSPPKLVEDPATKLRQQPQGHPAYTTTSRIAERGDQR
jgi:hypothetical protein